MSQQTIAISQIDDSGRLRPVDPQRAEAYAASIDAEGLAQPIRVRPAKNGGYILVTGGHRLAAMKLLGWTELTVGKHVIIADDSEDEAQGLELVENICSGMTALDRAIFLSEAKQRSDAKRLKVMQSKRKDSRFKEDSKFPETGIFLSERFSEAAAKKIGLSKTQIYEAVNIAKALDPQVIPQLRGTMIEDNQNELKLLAKMEAKDQCKALSVIRAKEAKTVTQARVVIGLDKQKADDPPRVRYAKLLAAWDATEGDDLERSQFMEDAGLVDLAEKGCLWKCWEKVDAEERERLMAKAGLAYVEGAKA